MPLSKKRNRIRMKRLRIAQAILGNRDSLLRKLGDTRRRLEAKAARVQWQSAGIAKLQEQMLVEQQRSTQLEGDLARLEVMLDSLLAERGSPVDQEEALETMNGGSP